MTTKCCCHDEEVKHVRNHQVCRAYHWFGGVTSVHGVGEQTCYRAHVLQELADQVARLSAIQSTSNLSSVEAESETGFTKEVMDLINNRPADAVNLILGNDDQLLTLLLRCMQIHKTQYTQWPIITAHPIVLWLHVFTSVAYSPDVVLDWLMSESIAAHAVLQLCKMCSTHTAVIADRLNSFSSVNAENNSTADGKSSSLPQETSAKTSLEATEGASATTMKRRLNSFSGVNTSQVRDDDFVAADSTLVEEQPSCVDSEHALTLGICENVNGVERTLTLKFCPNGNRLVTKPCKSSGISAKSLRIDHHLLFVNLLRELAVQLLRLCDRNLFPYNAKPLIRNLNAAVECLSLKN